MTFLILHGWTGTPQANWFPWLKQELENLGHRVLVPQFPNTDKPQLSEWLPLLNTILSKESTPVVLIGHSLGGVLMLHYLQQQKLIPPVPAAFFVASWGEDDGHLEPEIANFFFTPIDFSKIITQTKKIVCISSTSDPYINQKESKNLAKNLKAELIWIQNGGHLNTTAGFSTFPLLLDKINQTCIL